MRVYQFRHLGTTRAKYTLNIRAARAPAPFSIKKAPDSMHERFLAPRAAAFEHRIAALIADPGQGDQRDSIVSMPPLTAEQKAAFPDIDPHTLDGFIEKIGARQITCPTLLTAAEGDPTASAAEKLFSALEVSRKKLACFTHADGAGGHCEALNRSLYHQRSFDWLDATFAMVE